MSTRVWQSGIIRAPIAAVWTAVRSIDFRWLGNVSECNMQDKASPSQVGSVRIVLYKDKTMQKIKLLELSDATYAVTWELIESAPPITYLSAVHTIKLKRVTQNDSTFIEWTSDFSRDVSNEVLADAKLKQTDNFTALDVYCQPTKPGKDTPGDQKKASGKKGGDLGKPQLQRQLSLNSKNLLQKAFDKLDSKGAGFIDREAAIEYYQKVCKKADVQRERAQMVLADFQDKKITFETFAAFFKGVQLADQKLEQVLEDLGF